MQKKKTGVSYGVIHISIHPSTLDYQIAVGYEINVALGIFPEINKRSLLNNCSLEKSFKKNNR